MRVNSFYRVAAIRQQARAGCSVLSLATKYQLAITMIEEILACRTREAAARVLDEEERFDVASRFVQIGGHFVDVTSLIRKQ